MKTIYLIYKGQGMDSGFGDYTSSWDNAPMDLEGEILWFNSEKTAESIVKKLNKASISEFHKAGLSTSYDGKFPVEYEVRSLTIPENAPKDLSSFEKILNQESPYLNFFSASDPEFEVEESVKSLYPHLHECKECMYFGFSDASFDKESDCCIYCKESIEYFNNNSEDKDAIYITCPECLGSGDDDEYDAVCVLCNGGGIVKDD